MVKFSSHRTKKLCESALRKKAPRQFDSSVVDPAVCGAAGAYCAGALFFRELVVETLRQGRLRTGCPGDCLLPGRAALAGGSVAGGARLSQLHRAHWLVVRRL